MGKSMKPVRYAFAGIVIVAAVAGAVLFVRYRGAVNLSPKGPALAGEKSKGPAGAPVQIIEFSDFRCGACRKAEGVLSQLESDYPGKIRIVFKHFPLPNHAWSPVAHQAAECAHRGGVFWPYMQRLFQEQDKWPLGANPAQTFLVYAQELGLNPEVFAKCLVDPEVKEVVARESREGDVLKVQATPTFFINGERMVGPVALEMQAPSVIRGILGLPPPEPVTPSPGLSVLPAPMTPANPVSVDTPPAKVSDKA
ncbi:MAG: thioredoxin domain-containing protein [Candidatus Omnitrophota bacterium]|jgi:protein-disulfide isomerase